MNYINHLVIVIYEITRCLSISAFTSLVRIPIGVTSSAIGLKICVITAGINKYKSKIKKKKKKRDKIALPAKSKLSSIEVLISKALIDSNISHDKFVFINNGWKSFMIWKKKSKVPIINKSFKLYIKQCYLVVWSVEKIK